VLSVVFLLSKVPSQATHELPSTNKNVLVGQLVQAEVEQAVHPPENSNEQSLQTLFPSSTCVNVQAVPQVVNHEASIKVFFPSGQVRHEVEFLHVAQPAVEEHEPEHALFDKNFPAAHPVQALAPDPLHVAHDVSHCVQAPLDT
jgi:hypothetical protein